jgi:glycosyltransferase involved in cell wall biosynthesis
MKILHVSQGYPPAIGGTEKLIQRLSEELVRQFDDQVTVFTTNCFNAQAFYSPWLPRMPEGWEEIDGVKVRRFRVQSRISSLLRQPQWLAYNLGLPGNQYLRILSGGPIIPDLEEAIRSHPADVILASSFPLMHIFTTIKAAEKISRPYVLLGNLHPEDTWSFGKPVIYEAIRKAPRYIANTEYEAQYVMGKGAIRERVKTIGIGVDLEPFERITCKEAKFRLGLDGKPVIGFIGQIAATKGVDTLIRAMPIVWESFPEAHVLIAGSRTLYTGQIDEMITKMPDDRRANVLLSYDFSEEEKPWLFSAVDVVAYPSGYESFGISFLEAWASRKPVIGCRRGAIPWVVDAGKDGLLVEFQNEELLAEAIVLLLRNPEWARAMGEAGYSKVVSRFTWSEIARRFRGVYRELVPSIL